MTAPFTFHPDGTWSYASGGGRWLQVGETAIWNISNAPGLVFSAHVIASAMTGVMGHLKVGGPTGCFHASRDSSTASMESLAAALADLSSRARTRDGVPLARRGETADVAVGPP
jgi:hypothetical protein